MVVTIGWYAAGIVLQVSTLILALVVAWYALQARITIFEHTMEGHARSLMEHAARMDRFEERLVEVVGELQRVIGRMEVDRAEARSNRLRSRS